MADIENFELEKVITEWLNSNPINNKLTQLSDSERAIVLNQNIQELRKIELTDEEIFEVLKVRFADINLEKNQPAKKIYKYLAMTEILYLFIGGIIYFILQNVVLSIIDGLFFALEYYNKGNVVSNFKIIQSAWILIIFAIIISLAALYKRSDSIFEYVKNIKINLLKVLILFFTFYGMIVIHQYFHFEVLPFVKKYPEFREVFIKYFDYRRYFIQWFPLGLGLSYLILFFSYKKKSYFL